MGSDPQERPVLVYDEDLTHARSVAARAAPLLRPGRAVELDGPMAARAILAQARDHHVAAIVVGSYGRPPTAGPLPGDVATAGAHRADVPVLVIRAHGISGAAEEDGPILVCYDGSDEARAVVDAAAELLIGREMVVASFLASRRRRAAPPDAALAATSRDQASPGAARPAGGGVCLAVTR